MDKPATSINFYCSKTEVILCEQVFATLMTQSMCRSCPWLDLNGQARHLNWSYCSKTEVILCEQVSATLMTQRVAVVHILFWMDSCNNPIGPVVQTVTLTVICSNTHWKTDDTINSWQLSMAWFEWTSQTPQFVSTVQRLRWSCVSKSLQHWWPSQRVAVVHILFWMDSCNNRIGAIVHILFIMLTGQAWAAARAALVCIGLCIGQDRLWAAWPLYAQLMGSKSESKTLI